MPFGSRRLNALTVLCALLVTAIVVPATSGTAQAALPPGTSAYVAIPHVRVADTRAGHQMGFTRLNSSTVRVSFAGKVPKGSTTVVVNVTAVNPAGFGGVTVYPSGWAVPGTAHVVVTRKGQIRTNLVHVRLGPGQSVNLKTSTSMGLLVDLVGYYKEVTAPTSAGRFVPLPGSHRALNARSVGAAGSVAVNLAPFGVPIGASAAVVSLSTESGGKGAWSAYAMGTKLPNTNDLWLDAAGQRRSNQTIVKLNATNAYIRVFSQAGGKINVDVVGYYTGAGEAASVDGLFLPIASRTPYRRLDTRAKTLLAPIGPTTTEFSTGTANTVRGVVGNFRVMDAWDAGSITARQAGVSNVDMTVTRVTAPRENFSSHFFARASGRGVAVTMNKGAHAIVDIAGWFLGARPAASLAAPKLNVLKASPAYRLRWADFDVNGTRTWRAHSLGVVASTSNTTYATTVIADMGVAAAFNGLSTLGKTGNTMLFAHRTTHGAAFNDIQTMPVGATFGIQGANGKWYNYRVVDKRVMAPYYTPINDIAKRYPPVTAQLIACSKPDGTPTSTSYRIVVTGMLVSVTGN